MQQLFRIRNAGCLGAVFTLLLAGPSSGQPVTVDFESFSGMSFPGFAAGTIYVTGMSDAEGLLNFSNYAQPIAGYDFVPNTSITIGALGAYDHLFNGLEGANQVGLWQRSSQTLLASVSVPAGTAAPLQDGYRWIQIAPLTLSPGVTYTIASWNRGFEAIGTPLASSLTVDPRISLGAGYIDTLISGLQMPTRQGGPGRVFIGPGFAAPVPEPSPLLLLAAGLLGCAAFGRLRSKGSL